jgi:hypothetical protein
MNNRRRIRVLIAGGTAGYCGFWTCFANNVMDLFGMGSYMVKMYIHPDVVHAVTDYVCGFHYETNERFFEVDGDFGKQRGEVACVLI